MKLFFLSFLFFTVLSKFILLSMNFFLYVTNTNTYHRKMEKLFVSEEKRFFRIGHSGVIVLSHFPHPLSRQKHPQIDIHWGLVIRTGLSSCNQALGDLLIMDC